MHRLIKPMFWTLLFLVMMLVIDQLLVQVPPVHPAHAAVGNFYRDFRSRLIDLVFGEGRVAPESIEAVIEKQQDQKVPSSQHTQTGREQAKPAGQAKQQKSQRYLYSDGKGELQFADSLQEVPQEFRDQAQPMGE